MEHGAQSFQSEATGLNDAVQRAYAQLSDDYDRLIMVHGDLRIPFGLGTFDPGPGVTIVTDHLERGTNILVVPTGLDFRFSYGPNSKSLHQREAERLSLECRVVSDSPWRYDIDEPEDLTIVPDGI